MRATRSAQVRHWWAARGIIVSRLMRVRFGPVHLSRGSAARAFARHVGERAQRADERDRCREAAHEAQTAAGIGGSLLRFGGGEQLLEVLLPHCGPGVRAVSVRLIRCGQQHEARLPHPFDLALGDAELRRIDEIVGGIDPHDAARRSFEGGRRVVVARRVDLIQQIVRVESSSSRSMYFLQELIGGIAGRQRHLHLDRRAAGDEQEARRGAQRSPSVRCGIRPAAIRGRNESRP